VGRGKLLKTPNELADIAYQSSWEDWNERADWEEKNELIKKWQEVWRENARKIALLGGVQNLPIETIKTMVELESNVGQMIDYFFLGVEINDYR
jgi:hypothetical protein